MRPNLMFVFPLIVIIIGFLTDLYVWQGLKTLGYNFLSTNAVIWLRFIFWSFAFIIPIGLITGFIGSNSPAEPSVLLRIFLNLFFAYTAAKLSYGLFLFFEDLYRLIFAGFKYFSSNADVKIFVLTQQKFVFSLLGFLGFVLMFGIFIHGIFVNSYNYKTHYLNLEFENLPKSFDGFKIIQISDFHAGSHSNQKKAIKGIEFLNSLDADVLVFTGDMVNHKAEEFESFIDAFKNINPKFGKFAILGNHDYGDYVKWNSEKDKELNLKKLVDLETRAGFKVLLNDNYKIYKGEDYIFIAGVENWGHKFVKHGDLPLALSGISEQDFVVLLSHDPSHWDYEVKDYEKNIDLTLSGHTHGFQFGIETSWFKWSPVQYVYKEWSGLTEYKAKYRYINRGFGFIGLEGRVGIRPEITIIELKTK